VSCHAHADLIHVFFGETPMNVTHTIHNLAFGPKVIPNAAKATNPLNGLHKSAANDGKQALSVRSMASCVTRGVTPMWCFAVCRSQRPCLLRVLHQDRAYHIRVSQWRGGALLPVRGQQQRHLRTLSAAWYEQHFLKCEEFCGINMSHIETRGWQLFISDTISIR